MPFGMVMILEASSTSSKEIDLKIKVIDKEQSYFLYFLPYSIVHVEYAQFVILVVTRQPYHLDQ